VSAELPDLRVEEFRRRLEAASPVPVAPEVLERLFAHYRELRRWNPSLSLVGPAAAADVVERHYAESLAGVPLLPSAARVLVDVGSGAGFPGFVLAAARPELEVTLVEPRQRRWSFLLAACRRAALPCRCLDARVERPLAPGLPESIDVITTRALKLPPEALGALAERLAPGGRMLVWAGAAEPEAPPGLVRSGETAIAGTRHRRIVELTATGNQGH
jgi:16S rRNA (guanine527-N7)-methyltransferase